MSRAKVFVVLVWALFGLEWLTSHVFASRAQPKPLRIPFSEMPMDLLGPGWKGRDEPMSDGVRRIANVDAYLQRWYSDGQRSFWLYVGFVKGWNPMGIHSPDVCFPGTGHVQESKDIIDVPILPQKYPDCRFNEYVWTDAAGKRVYTLSTFFYNGKFEPSRQRLSMARFTGVSSTSDGTARTSRCRRTSRPVRG
jgi:hypothetical protein